MQSSPNLAMAEAHFTGAFVDFHRFDHAPAAFPKYLSRLPHDVITGEPLKYVRRGQVDYSVYSFGWDGKDDGGHYDGNTGEGDWVWPGTISIPRFTM
jgi:hypothetical protein